MNHSPTRWPMLLASLFSLVGCGGSGGSSPQATFDKFTSSMQKKDYAAGMSQLTPDSQALMLGMMAIEGVSGVPRN